MLQAFLLAQCQAEPINGLYTACHQLLQTQPVLSFPALFSPPCTGADGGDPHHLHIVGVLEHVQHRHDTWREGFKDFLEEDVDVEECMEPGCYRGG